jgi:hypothetical protein
MSDLLKEIAGKSLQMQTNRPADLDTLRKRMGARKQNASIAIYAYIDLRSSMDVLFQSMRNILDESNDLKTVIKTTTDWMEFVGGRAPVCFNLHEFSRFTLRTAEELKITKNRKDAAEILRVIQHYTCELSHWIDLDFPWPEVGIAYAKVKGDSAPLES